MANNRRTKVVTGTVRLSYANVWEPKSINGGTEKYSVSLIIPKSDKKTIDAINAAVDAAIEEGIAKFGGKKPNKAAIKLPLRDGDTERDDEAYADSYFINANSLTPPQIIDQSVNPIMNRSEIYSGVYARVSINGNLIIDPEQAEVVKRIYREYLEGYSMKKICQHLEADGVLTGAGKAKWYDSTINKILRNEKYMGDALLQKTYTTDFLTKKRVKNTGIVPQYYVEDDHEAIIPKEIFMQVQAELVRRRNVHATKSGKKRCFSGNNCFSQIACCGECDELYRRIHWNNRGKESIVWRCISRLEPSSAEENCTNRTVSEDLLKEISTKGINRICAGSDSFIRQIQENVAKAVMNTDSLSPEGLDKRLEELQKELIDKANSKQDYDAIADEIFRLRNQKQQSQMDAETQKEKSETHQGTAEFHRQPVHRDHRVRRKPRPKAG